MAKYVPCWAFYGCLTPRHVCALNTFPVFIHSNLEGALKILPGVTHLCETWGDKMLCFGLQGGGLVFLGQHPFPADVCTTDCVLLHHVVWPVPVLSDWSTPGLADWEEASVWHLEQDSHADPQGCCHLFPLGHFPGTLLSYNLDAVSAFSHSCWMNPFTQRLHWHLLFGVSQFPRCFGVQVKPMYLENKNDGNIQKYSLCDIFLNEVFKKKQLYNNNTHLF